MPDDQSSYQPPVPAAVRRAAERADQLIRDAGNTSVGDTPAGEGDNPVTNPDNPAAGEIQNENGGDGQPLGTTVVNEPSDGAGGGTPTQTDTSWQQRYQSLQGKYDAEVPRLTGQVRVLEGQVGQLQNLLASVRSAPPPAAAPAPARTAAREVPKEDIEAYGEDLVIAARRWARAEIEPEFAQMRSELAQLTTRSQSTETNIAHRTVEQSLDATIPNWRVINDDQAFIGWLAHIDPFSNRKRHDMLAEAYAQGNAQRTAAFFRAYTNEQTAVNPGSGNPPAHTPANPAAAGRVPLENLAAPGRGTIASPAGQGASSKRIWSNDQIAAFYRDVQRGKYETREAEKLRVEQDIFAAASEGRVR